MPPRLRHFIAHSPVTVAVVLTVTLVIVLAVTIPAIDRNPKKAFTFAISAAVFVGNIIRPRAGEIGARIVDDVFKKSASPEVAKPDGDSRAGDGRATNDSRDYQPTQHYVNNGPPVGDCPTSPPAPPPTDREEIEIVYVLPFTLAALTGAAMDAGHRELAPKKKRGKKRAKRR